MAPDTHTSTPAWWTGGDAPARQKTARAFVRGKFEPPHWSQETNFGEDSENQRCEVGVACTAAPLASDRGAARPHTLVVGRGPTYHTPTWSQTNRNPQSKQMR